ncbi:short-chain dehydrogenase/reductase SDR [Catenulispora acidiphila DSM 44928]|uniref:Short-chain dehydrogenase/reductase SDR n=1 Tax=Catenulispora acidiphila (strain DSM 44928 / JCM 14897 / NBRC 102108 / NRRL B-24433 / ID139908) TaxID=479433 RepID=C7Q4P2_CATAD|nr:SDR family oxidoreductase [Catenulispora acidiphila]ACU72011.1 short-chain dehydrogenase/reductase SDR [Catenulispora acidiphila DSM 44928]
MTQQQRPVALVSGVGRRAGIGAAIVQTLARDGWDVGFTYWRPYDDRMDWGRDEEALAAVSAAAEAHGARVHAVEADLALPETPEEVFAAVREALGDVRVLVMAHAESVDSSILDTSVEAWDQHFAVNARASWLLVREYAKGFAGPHGAGRIIGLTSGAVVNNLPYGASKGALDRLMKAAAVELRDLGVSSNAVDPGPTQTGWMDDNLATYISEHTPLGRTGVPTDCAELVAFLCSDRGGWINGQVVNSDGGFNAAR